VNWSKVSYDELDLLDLGQESNRTAVLFVTNLVLMILLLFVLITIFVVTGIVYYAPEEVDQLHQMEQVDSSILVHNLFRFLTIMPTALMIIQVCINLFLVLNENVDEIRFYTRQNLQGIWLLRGLFAITLLILMGLLAYRTAESDEESIADSRGGHKASIDKI